MLASGTIRQSLGYVEALSTSAKVSACTVTALAAIAVGVASASLFGLSILPPAAAYSIIGVGLASFVVMAVAIKIHHNNAIKSKVAHKWQNIAKRALPNYQAALQQWQLAVDAVVARHRRKATWQTIVPEAIQQYKGKCATKIQAVIRGFLVRRSFVKQKEAAVTMQAAYRGFIERKAFVQKREAAVAIQKTIRGFLVRQAYLKQKRAAVVLQKHFRGHALRRAQNAHFHGQVYRWMGAILAHLEGTPTEAAEAMKHMTKLHTKAFEWVSAPLMQMVLTLAVEAGMSEEQGRQLYNAVREKLKIKVSNGDGTCDVRNDYLATIALLLMHVDPSLAPEVRQLLQWTEKTSKQWQENAQALLSGQFVTQFKAAVTAIQEAADEKSEIKSISPASIKSFCVALEGRVKTGDYGSFLSIFQDQLNPEEYKAHWYRLVAHGNAYTHLTAGQKDPLVGDVVFSYREGGVNFYVSVQQQEGGSYNVHFCCAGTHELGGLARDVDPRSAKASFDAHIATQFFAIADAIYTKLQNDFVRDKGRLIQAHELEAIPISFETHGHSLAGHDAQLFANKIMDEKLRNSGLFHRLNLQSITINTQNALRVSVVDAELYKKLASQLLKKGIDLFIHVGFVPYDIVQHAGARHVGFDCEDLEEQYAEKTEGNGRFKITIAKHHCQALKNWGSMLLAGPHMAASAATKLVFTEDKEARKKVLQGGGFGTNGTWAEKPIDILLGAGKVPLWLLVGTAAKFGAESSNGAAQIRRVPSPTNRHDNEDGDSFIDVMTGVHCNTASPDF